MDKTTQYFNYIYNFLTNDLSTLLNCSCVNFSFRNYLSKDPTVSFLNKNHHILFKKGIDLKPFDLVLDFDRIEGFRKMNKHQSILFF